MNEGLLKINLNRRKLVFGGAAAAVSAVLPACSGNGWSENCIVTSSGATSLLEPSNQTLYAVPVGNDSTRLLYSSIDIAGFLWSGSVRRALFRYDPLSGQLDVIPHPFDAVVSHCICMADKVYMLGQTYPNLMVYNQATGQFSELAYPVADVDIWYGTEEIYGPVDGRHLYLFNRNQGGVIKWDTFLDSGTIVTNQFPTPLPYIGRYMPSDNAIWCNVWDFSVSPSVPMGLLRLDPVADSFTDWYPFPNDDTGLLPFTDPNSTNFYQWSLNGKVRPFDFRQRRYCQFLDVPGFGEQFGWIGMTSVYDDKWYFTLSTYDGSSLGIDCKPYHFLNGLLEFDPVTRNFALLTLDIPDAYFQIDYIYRTGNDFYANCNNIMQTSGDLDLGNEGELLFWQSVKPA